MPVYDTSGPSGQKSIAKGAFACLVVIAGSAALVVGSQQMSRKPMGVPSAVNKFAGQTGTATSLPAVPGGSVTGQVTFPTPPAATSDLPQFTPPVTSAPAPVVQQAPTAQPQPPYVEPATGRTATAPPIQAVEARASMPSDVREWLKHLERIEKRRRDLSTTQLAQVVTEFVTLTSLGGSQAMLQGLLGDEDSTLDTKNTAASQLATHVGVQKSAWQALIGDYRSLAPPRECVPVANSYGQAVGETRQMVTEVLDQLVHAASDPKAAVATLMSMRGTSHSRIDVAAKESDSGVQVICDRYGEVKWFSVSADVGSEFGRLAANWSP